MQQHRLPRLGFREGQGRSFRLLDYFPRRGKFPIQTTENALLTSTDRKYIQVRPIRMNSV